MIATARGVTGLLRSIIDDDEEEEDSSDEEEKDQASSSSSEEEEEQQQSICNGKIKDSCCHYAPSPLPSSSSSSPSSSHLCRVGLLTYGHHALPLGEETHLHDEGT